MNSRPNALALAIAFAVLCGIWGEFPIAAKVGTEASRLLVAAVRFLLAGAVGRRGPCAGRLAPPHRRYLGVLFLIFWP